ncbi:hypothetical protein [Mycobacterium shottsii]|nr:hypothetical protein [Mycobacterium shottsii]
MLGASDSAASAPCRFREQVAAAASHPPMKRAQQLANGDGVASSAAPGSCQGRVLDSGFGLMRRRPIDLAGFLFNGKRYATEAEYQRSVDAWRERRRRLLALVSRDDAEREA